jgi:antirestriction protein ArdC
MPNTPRRFLSQFTGTPSRRGIIRVSALCDLCRYRHNAHLTGHPSRCNRQLGNRFGSESYAAEELIAELGSAFLSAELQLDTEPRIDNAPYIENWLRVLKNDKRAIFTAAGKAQQAVDWLASRQKREQAA